MTAISNENDDTLSQYFNTLPMCIIEVNGNKARYNRCNRSYRDFIQRTMGMSYDTREIDCEDLSGKPGESLFRAVFQCSRGGSTGILDERMNEDTVAHTLIRRVAVNPVTGTVAIAVAVLAVVREGGDAGTSYSQMARAMAADYVVLYYVSLDTERYIQYSPDSEREDLAMERHGEDFFAEARRQAMVQRECRQGPGFRGSFQNDLPIND